MQNNVLDGEGEDVISFNRLMGHTPHVTHPLQPLLVTLHGPDLSHPLFVQHLSVSLSVGHTSDSRAVNPA